MEGAEDDEEEDTLAGVSAYALRTFLRQTRELTYQAVGQVAARVPALWRAVALRPAFLVSSTRTPCTAAVADDGLPISCLLNIVTCHDYKVQRFGPLCPALHPPCLIRLCHERARHCS